MSDSGPLHTGRQRGKIDRVQASYAFIKMGDRDVFLLPSAMQKTSPRQFNELAKGQDVEFIVIEHPRGLRAIEVRTV